MKLEACVQKACEVITQRAEWVRKQSYKRGFGRETEERCNHRRFVNVAYIAYAAWLLVQEARRRGCDRSDRSDSGWE